MSTTEIQKVIFIGNKTKKEKRTSFLKVKKLRDNQNQNHAHLAQKRALKKIFFIKK